MLLTNFSKSVMRCAYKIQFLKFSESNFHILFMFEKVFEFGTLVIIRLSRKLSHSLFEDCGYYYIIFRFFEFFDFGNIILPFVLSFRLITK